MYTVHHMLINNHFYLLDLVETRLIHTFCHLKARTDVTYSCKEERSQHSDEQPAAACKP